MLVAVVAFASLRPITALDEGVELLFLPARAALELGAPAALRGSLSTARAAEGGGLGNMGTDAAEAGRTRDRELAEELGARSALAARPQRLRLADGVRAVTARVLARPDGRLDELEVLLEDPRGIERGAPVVWGDAFLGVVARVPSAHATGRRRHLARVRLVTARDSRVKGITSVDAMPERGSADARPIRMVVGGIAPRGEGFALAVHSPEDDPAGGVPVVLAEDEGSELALANGWGLGRVVRGRDALRDEDRLVGLAPDVDLESGIARVLVLTQSTTPAEALAAPEAGSWLSCERGPLLDARGREAFPLLAGSRSGLAPGAAVADGLRFVGRVRRAGPLAGSVERLEQPGASVHAVALLEEGGRLPIVLGRLTSLGEVAPGQLHLRWIGSAEVSRRAGLQASLWTLAGERGVPGGLLLGTCALPVGPGPHDLLVERPSSLAEPPLVLSAWIPGEVAR